MGAKFEDSRGLVTFGAGEPGTEGKADDGADGDAGTAEGGGSERNPRGVDHRAGEAVFRGLVAELEDLGAGGVRPEESVVNDGGEVLWRGEGVGCEGCGVEVFGSVREWIGDRQRIQKLAPSTRGESFAGLLSIILW
jgi:hypothetical protein